MEIKNIPKILVLIFLTLFFTLNGNAQQKNKGNLSGIIKDETNTPLPGAEVYIEIDDRVIGVISDFDGKFVITKTPEGNQNLIVKYLGYKEKRTPITVIGNKTIDVGEIMLQPIAENLEEVIISGRSKGQVRSLNIQKSSDNIKNVISLEQASKFPDSNIGDALKRVSGVSIETDQGEARSVSVREMALKLLLSVI